VLFTIYNLHIKINNKIFFYKQLNLYIDIIIIYVYYKDIYNINIKV